MKNSNILKIGSLSVLFVSLTACNAIPKAQNGKIVATTNLPIEQPYRVYDSETKSGGQSIAQQNWQDFFSDERLKQLIQLGLDNNKDVNAQVLAMQRARAAYQITDNSNIPSINATGTISYGATESQDKNPSDSYRVNLASTSYEFDFWGKVANSKTSALESYFATSEARDAAQVSLISSIAQAYVNFSYASAQLKLAKETLATREESLRLNKLRFKAGIDSELTSVQAQSAVEAARIAIATQETNLLQLHNALQYLVGTQFDSNLLPPPAIKNITNNKIFATGLPSDLLLNRPDIRQNEHALSKAGADIAVARANFFPTISLSASTGTGSTDLSDLFKSGTFNWGITPTISLPIFNKTLKIQHQVAEIDQKIALNSYEKSIQNAFKEVNDVFATRATLNTQLDAYNKALEASNKNYAISSARFKAGLDNYLGVLDAQRAVYSSHQSVLNTQQSILNSQIQLYEALGGGVTHQTPSAPSSTPNVVDKVKDMVKHHTDKTATQP